MARRTTARRTRLLDDLMREARRTGSTGALHARALGERMGLNSTDFECLDVLDWTGPIPAGMTPFASAPPSMLNATVPPKYVPFLLVVLTVTGAVPVSPVVASATVAPDVVVKSRLTLPIEIPTG